MWSWPWAHWLAVPWEWPAVHAPLLLSLSHCCSGTSQLLAMKAFPDFEQLHTRGRGSGSCGLVRGPEQEPKIARSYLLGSRHHTPGQTVPPPRRSAVTRRPARSGPVSLHSSLRPRHVPARALAGQSQGPRTRGTRTLAHAPGPRRTLPRPARASTQRRSGYLAAAPRRRPPRPERVPAGSAPSRRYSRRCAGQPPWPGRAACVPSRACAPRRPRTCRVGRSALCVTQLQSAASRVPHRGESQGRTGVSQAYPRHLTCGVWPPQRPLDWHWCGCLPPEGLVASFSVKRESPRAAKGRGVPAGGA